MNLRRKTLLRALIWAFAVTLPNAALAALTDIGPNWGTVLALAGCSYYFGSRSEEAA
jgi:hypothetical protein